MYMYVHMYMNMYMYSTLHVLLTGVYPKLMSNQSTLQYGTYTSCMYKSVHNVMFVSVG